MQEIKRYTHLKIAAHATLWLVSMCIHLFLFFYNEGNFYINLTVIFKALILNAGFAIAVYINLYILIPKFLKQKNYIFYIFWLVLLLTFSSLFIQFLLLIPLHGILELPTRLHSFDSNLHAAYFTASLIYVAFTSFLKFINDWLKLQDLNLKIAKIEQQKLEAELTTLKGQLNPHFLFNSLNNIYSLALVKSDKVPELILTLADLMRHIIYNSRENYIDLYKEIGFVDNFVAMQKIRVAMPARIKYTIRGTVPDARIAPLIFEPFIDNAFKHGMPGNIEKDFISIHFDFTIPDWLTFSIENYCEPEPNKQHQNGGIGISNVKKRLQLLYHPEEYQLQINHQDNSHLVNLRLKLK
ncbi:MAG TPA: histidine kinase [Mariniphaga sp.]|nr:histidine kinase [Mariniphaga sp.]